MPKAAVYHFTDKSTTRPIIYQKTLQQLKDYSSFLGYPDTDVFCDYDLHRTKQPEFKRLLECAQNYEAIISKDFYHLSRSTMTCMSIMKELRDKGVCIYTMENGSFVFEKEPLDRPLRVVSYLVYADESKRSEEIISLQNEIFRLFVKEETSWTLIDQYYDITKLQNVGEQPNLQKLIAVKGKYDLVLTHNLNDINRRTAAFCKARELLQMDIYSLQDGYLRYNKMANGEDQL